MEKLKKRIKDSLKRLLYRIVEEINNAYRIYLMGKGE